MILLLSFLSCGKDELGLQVGDVSSIRVEPAQMELTTRPDTPVTVQFAAYATLSDGQEVEMDLISWNSSNLSAGSIDEDGLFETVDTNGGVTSISANSLGVEGTARVTVIFSTDILEAGLSEELPSAFVASEAVEDNGLNVTYPLNNVIIPRNLEGLGFKWSDDSNVQNTVYRVQFQSEITDISVFVSDLHWISTSELWEMISAANRKGLVTVNVEAGDWDGSNLTNVRQGPDIEINVNRFDARGSVLYWGIFEETHTASIMRIPIGTTDVDQFWTCEGQNCCIGCHALADDADRMVVTHSGNKFSIVDITEPTAPEEIVPINDNERASFKTLSPDGKYMFGIEGPVATLYDLESGQAIKDFNFTSPISHPDWSPDGTQIVYVRITGSAASDLEFKGGEIVQVDFNSETLELENEVVLKERDVTYNYYYPAYSPDGDWIVYNRAKNEHPRADGHMGCYAAPDAELWLMSRDSSNDIRLDSANGEGNLQNSYPRWGPLPDDDILWLAFSSRRGYPINPTTMPQIWIVGINPELAYQGEDPSSTPIWLPGQSVLNDNHLPVWWSK
jgi:Tol biopolymer transport system component